MSTDWYPDADDFDFFAIAAAPSSIGGFIVFIVLVAICAGLIYVGDNACAEHCPNEGFKRIEHECYCVDSSGVLRIAPEIND